MADFDGALIPRAIFAETKFSDDKVGQLITGNTRVVVVGGAPPQVTGLTPAPGAIRAGTAISFNVTDDVGFAKILVLVEFTSGAYEVIHDGTSFAAAYSALSTRTVISGGFAFSCRRAGGWPSGFTLRTVAIDSSGSEAT